MKLKIREPNLNKTLTIKSYITFTASFTAKTYRDRKKAEKFKSTGQ